MKKWLFLALVFALSLSLVACSEDTAPASGPKISTGLVIEYDQNILLNIYDIRVSVDDSALGTQKQGEKKLYELNLPEGGHTLTLSEFGNDANITTETLEMSEGNYYYFFIKTRDSGITIEKRDTMTLDEAQALTGLEEDEGTEVSEDSQSEPTDDTGNEPAEEIDLNAINATNSADSDKDFVGKTYRIEGIVGEALPADDSSDAWITIHPYVMAKGMGNELDLEMNFWLKSDAFDAIGGESCSGNEVEITAVLSNIGRNTMSDDPEIKGYPIDLELNTISAKLLSDEKAESRTAADVLQENTTQENSSERYPSGISTWDGDHTELKDLIKANINDEGSYEHVETTWRYIESETTQQEINALSASIGWNDTISIGDFLIITDFSCKNVFDATVKNTAFGIEYSDGSVELLGIA